MSLPRRLAAPAATWERDVDVVVVGSGAAGLAVGLAVRPVRSVLVVTKDVLSAGSTQWAQGGLAGVLHPEDTLEHHVRDTLDAGAGLCDEAVVRQLVEEAPKSIRYLMRLGAAFDPSHDGPDDPGRPDGLGDDVPSGPSGPSSPGGPDGPDVPSGPDGPGGPDGPDVPRGPDGPSGPGGLAGFGGDVALTREGGHSFDRIVHSGGDRSGAEVQRTLDQSAMNAGVDVMSHAFALDLLLGRAADGASQAAGVRIARTAPDGRLVSVGIVTARAVVLACGGYGQVFASTSNPPAVTGDGVALALRAGMPVRDLEFVQFHPTVMWRGPDATGQQALVSEAVRGEGAILYDAAGERVMAGVHPLEDLAPRDVVSAAISRRMADAPAGVPDHVYLDATHLGERFHRRFPSITEACREVGLDPARDRIPVAPAAHYACGGIVAALDGTTALRGAYAVGETTSTGVHGANRLASNSLTESVVAGTRLGRELAWELPDRVEPDRAPGSQDPPGAERDRAGGGRSLDPALLPEMRAAMSRHVGVLRSAASLDAARSELRRIAADVAEATWSEGPSPARRSWETVNLLTVATAIVAAARARTESRGCHRRTDHPEPRPEWATHLRVELDDEGEIRVVGGPAGA